MGRRVDGGIVEQYEMKVKGGILEVERLKVRWKKGWGRVNQK